MTVSLFFGHSYAQEYKFNQFYNAPLNLNPAMTGKLSGLYRLVANYRVQSQPVSSPAPYNTFSVSTDFGLRPNDYNGDILGLGIIASNDRQAAGALNTTDLMASLAYHKSFGYEHDHYLSVGFQFGFKSRKLDISQLYFESQFNQMLNSFDLSLPNLENFDRESFFTPNMNAGVFWSSNFSKLVSAYAGVSMFNLIKPRDNFFNSTSERFIKVNAHGGVVFNIHNKIMINPNAIYTQQSNLNNWVGGSTLSYNLSGDTNPYETSVFAGAWYDGGGAIIASAGVQIKSIQFTFSYDRTISDFKSANNGFGAFETSIIYQSPSKTGEKRYSIMHCPKF